MILTTTMHLAILGLLLQPVLLSDAEQQATQRGQVPVRTEVFPTAATGGKAAGRGIGAIVIERPPAAVFAVLARFEDKIEYMPRLKALRILEQQPGRVRVHMTVDASITTVRYTLWFALDPAAGVISWALDRGAAGNSIADAEGAYEARPLGAGRTLLVYHSSVDTGRAVPRFMQDFLTRRSIPDLLRAIKRRVESR